MDYFFRQDMWQYCLPAFRHVPADLPALSDGPHRSRQARVWKSLVAGKPSLWQPSLPSPLEPGEIITFAEMHAVIRDALHQRAAPPPPTLIGTWFVSPDSFVEKPWLPPHLLGMPLFSEGAAILGTNKGKWGLSILARVIMKQPADEPHHWYPSSHCKARYLCP